MKVPRIVALTRCNACLSQLRVQLTWLPGTAPLVVAGVNVQLTVSTVVPGGCSTVIVAVVKDTSVIVSVHCGFGHSGAPGIGVTAAAVRTSKETLPFFIAPSGMA